ncbi:UNVERIFIED_CONTAM: hypothetical protein Slati_3871400 [Sesamum latifolium]|uniref:Reverse transcriptase zinc-binding domain-containing protein n=1 Tax=Sesamum latifolium TaxID=2727402 RepID=A0AAW2TL64_9LAMI
MGFRVTSPPRVLAQEANVSALIDGNCGSWRMELVMQVFDEEEAKLIMSIALSQLNCPDTLVWHYSNDGVFSVSSAYRLALQCARQQLPSTSNTHNSINNVEAAADWNFIWKSQVPHKVRTFVWRACHEAMPTVMNLARRIPTIET